MAGVEALTLLGEYSQAFTDAKKEYMTNRYLRQLGLGRCQN